METDVVIVGTGFAGLGQAIRLRQEGIDSFVVLERAGDVGGTWRDNTYPGAACDVPSHLYSFSFAPNPEWSRSFSAQDEILAYLRDCADRLGVRPHLRFGHEVTGARWCADEGRWHVETTGGNYRARVLVSATGALSDPCLPGLPGLDRFAGTTFHSARWDHDHDLTGRRVAVIGTGASAIQFVPQIQPKVENLTLFQRTPPWVLPRWDRPFRGWERWLFRNLPLTQRLARAGIYWGREGYVLGFAFDPRVMRAAERFARRHLHHQVPGTELRAKLTPDYTIGCKRVLISNDYYPSLTQPNVDVVTDPIGEIRPAGVMTAGGEMHPVDTIIFGTGFRVTDIPAAARICGRDGTSLAEHWHGGMEAHKGTSVAGFPNLFLLVGPNTGLGHSSQVFMIESQLAYVTDAVRCVLGAGAAATVEVRPEAQAAWNDDIQAAMGRTVWTTGGCRSWYLDEQGRNTTLWPDFTWRFRRHTRRFDPGAYVLSVDGDRPRHVGAVNGAHVRVAPGLGEGVLEGPRVLG
ncbi:MAG: flavin-containing monooxygenase [Acidimicrobiia bacterium]